MKRVRRGPNLSNIKPHQNAKYMPKFPVDAMVSVWTSLKPRRVLKVGRYAEIKYGDPATASRKRLATRELQRPGRRHCIHREFPAHNAGYIDRINTAVKGMVLIRYFIGPSVS